MSDFFSRIEGILGGDSSITPVSRIETMLKELVDEAGGTDEETVRGIVQDAIADLIDGAPTSFDTLKELSDWIANHETQYNAILSLANGKQDRLAFDNAPTYESNNPVKSGGVYTALAGKQDTLTFDNTPTENSDNPVKSGGVYSALAGKVNVSDIDSVPTENSNDPVSSGGVYTALSGKQDTLTFDNVPTENSNNPVKSGGVYEALSGVASQELTWNQYDALTQEQKMDGTVRYIIDRDSLPPYGSWANSFDEQLANALKAAHAGEIDLQEDLGWKVGDVRTISIDTFTADGRTFPAQDIDIVITSFNDYNNCGCVMQFDFKDCLSVTARMFTTNSNSNGYAGTTMRNYILPALAEALPKWLKDALITFDVLGANHGSYNATIITIPNNKLALRSVKELQSDYDTRYFYSEGTYIPYYGTNQRKKKLGHNGSNDLWWSRSPYSSQGYEYGVVWNNGTISTKYANEYHGVAPFGCL